MKKQGTVQQQRHAPFTDLHVHAGLALALSAGFGIAALLAAQQAFGIDLDRWWPVLLQVHGHAQVFGWLGLFIMGVSLYFLPRLAGAPLRSPAAAHASAALLAGGIALGSVAQVGLFGGAPSWRTPLLAANLAQVLGVCLYVGLVSACLVTADPSRRPLLALRMCFASTLVGWVASAALSAWQTVIAVDQLGLLHPGWSRLGLDLFAGFVLLPVAFAFSIRTFPLYLRLPAVRWSVDRLIGLYLGGLVLQTGGQVAGLVSHSMGPGLADLAGFNGAAGRIVKAAAILWFIWRLDLLTRRRPAWTIEREGEPPEQPLNHPRPRPHLPDYGEFGHFEWHLLAAYGFLALGALIEIHGGVTALSGFWAPIAADTLRHVYLAGFGTLLLLGMAPRMLPGFWGLRRPAFARLVDVSFGLALPAAVLRVLPGLTPPGPWTDTLNHAFGVSGLLGWLAVVALAVNLWWTRSQVGAGGA